MLVEYTTFIENVINVENNDYINFSVQRCIEILESVPLALHKHLMI